MIARAATIAALAACAAREPEAVAIESPPHAIAPMPEPPRLPASVARYHMRRHFDDLRLIERVLIAGKLEDGTTLGVLLAREEDDPALTPYKEYGERVSQAAGALSRATGVDEALRGVSAVAAECASCHRAAVARLRLPAPPAVPERPTMARHAWAADRLWEGVIAGDTDRWRRGLAVLAESPFGAPPSKLQAIATAQLATYTTELAPRAAAYGTILIECATCHTRLRVERP